MSLERPPTASEPVARPWPLLGDVRPTRPPAETSLWRTQDAALVVLGFGLGLPLAALAGSPMPLAGALLLVVGAWATAHWPGSPRAGTTTDSPQVALTEAIETSRRRLRRQTRGVWRIDPLLQDVRLPEAVAEAWRLTLDAAVACLWRLDGSGDGAETTAVAGLRVSIDRIDEGTGPHLRLCVSVARCAVADLAGCDEMRHLRRVSARLGAQLDWSATPGGPAEVELVLPLA